MNTDLIDRSLQSFDAAAHVDASAQSRRARQALDTAVAQPRPRRIPNKAIRRLAVAGGLAAAMVGAAVVVPGQSGTPVAYAGWAPTAAVLTGSQARAAKQECVGPAADEDSPMNMPSRDPDVIIAEQRGPWTFVAYSWSSGERGSCLRNTGRASGSEDMGMSWIGGKPEAIGGRPRPVPGHESIEANGLLTLDQPQGAVYQLTGDAGSDVTRVVVHAGALGDVEATLSDGHFAAWWPEARIEPLGPFNPDVTLHLTDGTSVTKQLSSYTHVQL